MEGFVSWLTQLSAATLYLIIGATTFFENALPPIPSDVAVTLGGFLSQHSTISPVGVFLVGWLSNVAGSVVVYYLARRYGRDFLSGRLGRRLLPPDAILAMEREYLRYGTIGIFLGRLLPGFRSIVAPFTGLINIPVWRAMLPIAVAAGIWYAFLTWAGARLGEEWETINRLLKHLNSTLAVIAVVAIALVVFMVLRARKKRPPPRDRLLRAVHRALGDTRPSVPVTGKDPAREGAATLLFELTRNAEAIPAEDRAALAAHFRTAWGLDLETMPPETVERAANATHEMAAMVTREYDHERRLSLATRLYQLARSDGTVSRHEDQLMRRAGQLLGLAPEDLVEARRRADV
ncbi:MAG: VTT domain-containing protein [Gemmatimonadales bacterium]